MSDFAIEYALAINGDIYCERRPNVLMPSPVSDPKPVVFDSKTDAVAAAGRIRDDLRSRYHIDPIITVVHRYCSDWTGADIGHELADRFAQLLAESEADNG